MRKIAITAALAALVPAFANASVILASPGANTDIGAGNLVLGGVIVQPGGANFFAFTATEALSIDSIAFTLNGFSETDLLNVEWGVNGLTSSLAPGDIDDNGFLFVGTQIEKVNLTFSAGDTFSILVEDGITEAVDFDFTFRTAVVPVPAAGLLLGSLLLGGAALARRKAA